MESSEIAAASSAIGRTSRYTRRADALHQPDCAAGGRSEEHTSELQSLRHLVCRLLLGKKNKRYHAMLLFSHVWSSHIPSDNPHAFPFPFSLSPLSSRIEILT